MSTDMYYFEIGSPFGDEVPIYTRTLIKNNVPDTDTEIDNIMSGDFSGWSFWSMPSSSEMQNGLDIGMNDADDKLLVFHIPAALETHFLKNAPLENVRAKGFGRVDVVSATKTLPRGNNNPKWASVELKLGRSMTSIKTNNPRATDDGHEIKKFPFFFNFVDSLTGISPATKIGHMVHHPHSHKAKKLFTHGGIHPPTFTNMIVLV